MNNLTIDLQSAKEALTQEELHILSVLANKVEIYETEQVECNCPKHKFERILNEIDEEVGLSSVISTLAAQHGIPVQNIKLVEFDGDLNEMFGMPKFVPSAPGKGKTGFIGF